VDEQPIIASGFGGFEETGLVQGLTSSFADVQVKFVLVRTWRLDRELGRIRPPLPLVIPHPPLVRTRRLEVPPSLVDDVADDQTLLFDHHAVAPTVRRDVASFRDR
jgi:hypothetical protein